MDEKLDKAEYQRARNYDDLYDMQHRVGSDVIEAARLNDDWYFEWFEEMESAKMDQIYVPKLNKKLTPQQLAEYENERNRQSSSNSKSSISQNERNRPSSSSLNGPMRQSGWNGLEGQQ